MTEEDNAKLVRAIATIFLCDDVKLNATRERATTEKIDFHKLVVSEALGIEMKAVTPEQRSVSKGLLFAKTYGVSPDAFRAQIRR